VLALAINAYGEALWQWDRPSPVSGAPALRQTLAAICHDCFSRRHLSVEHFWGIGLSAPGLLDSTRTTWTLSRQMPQLVGETPAEQLTDATGLPAQLEDNSRAKALAERLWGWGREHDHFLLVDLDRGIGSGIILDGRLFRGVTGHSGEIGQFHVRPDIRPPSGPAHDFLEEAVGLDALVARYNLAAQPETIPDFGPLFDKARQGDSHAREILEEAGRLMGVTLANMRNFFDLPICLTGRLLQAGELVTQPMETAFRENSLLPNGDLGRTHLPENGAALGAAALIYVAVLTI
ncbi:ROK family protein, partial [bacterium]|nr:ROK family protein [bacterium]